MNVRHWNVSTVDSPPYGMTRYEDELAEGLSHLGVDVDRTRRRAGLLGNTVASWVTRYRPGSADLVHATFQTVAPAAFVRRPDRFVVTVHDLTPLVYPEEVTDLSMRMQWALTPRALRRADRVIAISEFTRQEVGRLTDVPLADVDVVHQGVDLDRYRPLDREACRDHFDLDADATYLLVVSSNAPHKRTDEAREVLRAVRRERDDVKLLKAGYGEELPDEAVISTGWVDEADMPKLYNAADVYLHTSEYEGFGLPVLEAMACGTPVVARDVASIPEIVGDVYELASGDASGRALASHVFDRLDRGAAEDAVDRAERFPWSATARATKAIYEEVLDGCES